MSRLLRLDRSGDQVVDRSGRPLTETADVESVDAESVRRIIRVVLCDERRETGGDMDRIDSRSVSRKLHTDAG